MATAYIVGKRVCVKLPYGHGATPRLKELGSHWDPQAKNWWIGLGKRAEFERILSEHPDEVRLVEIDCPALWGSSLDEMKKLGGQFDPTTKNWSVPEGKLSEANHLAKQARLAVADRAARPGLATEKQLNVIRKCRDSGQWFDVFDGASPYHAVEGPTNEEIERITSSEASRLIAQIISDRN